MPSSASITMPETRGLYASQSVEVRLADSARLAEATIQGAQQVLSSEERARAHRFRSHELSTRFIAGRAMLRTTLAEELQIPASDITFGRTHTGKPVLDMPCDPVLDFSLSYAGPLILMAIGRGVRVGADIEPLRPVPEAETIVARHFAASEKARWDRLADCVRPRAFLEAWTRKEAVLKATGAGIAQGLRRAKVTFGPGVTPRIISVEEDPGHDWHLHALSDIEGYIAAVVTEGTIGTESAEVQKWPQKKRTG